MTNDVKYDQRVQRIAKALHIAGFQVRIVGRSMRLTGTFTLDIPFKLLRCWFEEGPLFYLEYNIRLLFYLWRKRPDIIVSNDADTLFACAFGKIGSSKLVYDSHEWFTEVPELLDKPFKRRIWHYLQRWLIPRADFCISVGPKLCQRLASLFGSHFHSIRNLPYARELSNSSTNNISKKIMIYQGALNEGRGIEQAILALHDLPEWNLWIAGDGPLREVMTDMVIQKGLQDRVTFYGRLTPEVLWDLTPNCSVGLNLLLTRSKNYYFSLANKYFDYVQAGIPVVTMNFPEYRLLQEEFAVAELIEECSSESLVKAIENLSIPENYSSCRSAVLEARKVWHWDGEKDKLIDLYNSFR